MADWIRFLVAEKLFGFDDPLFPATRVTVGESGLFRSDGLDRRPWSNAGPIRVIFKDAFERARLPYFHAHSFRKMLTRLGQKTCGGSIEAMKAWSQNLGHEEFMTTFASYGALRRSQQAEIMASMSVTCTLTEPVRAKLGLWNARLCPKADTWAAPPSAYVRSSVDGRQVRALASGIGLIDACRETDSRCSTALLSRPLFAHHHLQRVGDQRARAYPRLVQSLNR